MKKLTFRLFVVIMLIYVAGSVAPLFSQDGSPGHHHGPTTAPPPPPVAPPVGAPVQGLGGPQAQPGGPPQEDPQGFPTDAQMDRASGFPGCQRG